MSAFREFMLVFCSKLRYYSVRVVESGVLWSLVGDKWREEPIGPQRKGHYGAVRRGVSLCLWVSIIIRLTQKAG